MNTIKAFLILFVGYAQTKLFHVADQKVSGYYIMCDTQALWLPTWVYFGGEHVLIMSILCAGYYIAGSNQVASFLSQLFELECFDLLDYFVFYNKPWWPWFDLEYSDIKLTCILILILCNLWSLKPSSH
jgi:hypothetical protein